MKKKWIKRIAAAAMCVLILFFGTDLALRWASSSEWMRRFALEKAAEATGREVRLKAMSASLMGVKLDGLEVSEAGGFKNGTFVSVDRLRLRMALLHLLHGHLKLHSLVVNGAEANIVREADGSFNFDSLLSPSSPQPQTQDQPEDPFNITLHQLTVRRVNVTYTDLRQPAKAAAKDIYVDVQRFGFDRTFYAKINSTLSYEADGNTFVVPAGLSAQVLLANLDMNAAQAEVSDFSAKYGDAAVNMRVFAKNFEKPSVKITAQVRNLSSDTIKTFAPDAPEFLIPRLSAEISLLADLAAEKVTVSALSFLMPGVQATASGYAGYGKKLAYDFNSAFDIRLGELIALAPALAREYKLSGALNGAAEVSDRRVTASVSVQEAGGFIPYAGELAQVSAELALDESADFTEGSANGKISGRLNGEDFSGDFKVTQTKQVIDAVLNGSAKRVVLPPAPAQQDNAAEPEFVQDTQLAPAERQPWPLPPLNVRTNLWIGSIDAPYFYGTDITFKSALKGITPDLKGAQGSLNLAMGGGEIKDLYKLTNANALTKVLFLSLNVVGKVFNSLNVFAVLNGLGSGIVSAVGGGEEEKPADMVVQTVTGPDGAPMQIMVPYTDRKIEGRMAYDKFATDVNFKNGTADVKDGTFVSDMMSFKLNGTTNFNTGKINMTVQAAPGKHEVDGIMPLTLKVGGTVSDPKGSMSMIGSVSSLVTQGIGNNFASRSVKKGIGGFFGLFKKKSAPQEDASGGDAPVTSAETPDAAAQTPQEAVGTGPEL